MFLFFNVFYNKEENPFYLLCYFFQKLHLRYSRVSSEFISVIEYSREI